MARRFLSIKPRLMRLKVPLDYSKYPPNWLSEIRPRILSRAKGKCEFCGIKNYTLAPNGTKVVLTIAHLDHDSGNPNVTDDRLRALCQRCHLNYDRHRHSYQRTFNRRARYGWQMSIRF